MFIFDGHVVIFRFFGVYVNDLLITRTYQGSMYNLFDELICLSVKNLGHARRFLGTCIQYDEETGYE